jgi:hypothetical protein
MSAIEDIARALQSAPPRPAMEFSPNILERVQQRLRRQGPVCFEGDIPQFVERAMEQLHGSIYSSALRARMDGWAQQANSYVFLREGEPHAVLLYQLRGRTLTVRNEVFTIGAHDIALFADHMLARYPQIGVIRMHSIDTDLALLRMPMLKVQTKEDIVVDLPDDQQSYWSSLGKTTRQNIKYYRNKLTREQGEFTLLIEQGENITREAFDAVAQLNRCRMQSKGKQYIGTDDSLEQTWRFTRQTGMVLRLMVQGRVVAGAICLRAGDNWHLDTIAHDPELNNYRLGTLCCFLTIEECIKRGGREFHFLWGQYDYKYRFLGKERKLYDLAIYRSRSNMALLPQAMLAAWSQRAKRRARDWLAYRA